MMMMSFQQSAHGIYQNNEKHKNRQLFFHILSLVVYWLKSQIIYKSKKNGSLKGKHKNNQNYFLNNSFFKQIISLCTENRTFITQQYLKIKQDYSFNKQTIFNAVSIVVQNRVDWRVFLLSIVRLQNRTALLSKALKQIVPAGKRDHEIIRLSKMTYLHFPIILMKSKQSIQQNEENFIFTLEDLPQSIQPKLLPIIKILNIQQIDLQQLKVLLSKGIPEQASRIRQYVWKLVLGYLPKNKRQWATQIKFHEKIYADLIEQYLNCQKYANAPLMMDKSSPKWKSYQSDYQLWDQIQKDTCRTQAQLNFFSTIAPAFPIPFFSNTRKQKYKLISGSQQLCQVSRQEQKKTYRYDYMTRILFIFARLNPKVQYVQGMNEIIAPIFYLVNQRSSYRGSIQEASCFFMFNNVMSDILEMHIKDFGQKENPVHHRLNHISDMLLALEPKTWQKLQLMKIQPFYYSFRWVTLLFSQQFEMFQTLRVWESIFSHDDRTSYCNFFSLALIMSSRDIIAVSEYGQILQHLKSISQKVKIQQVIQSANYLHRRYKKGELMELAEKNRKRITKDVQVKGNRLLRLMKRIF